MISPAKLKMLRDKAIEKVTEDFISDEISESEAKAKVEKIYKAYNSEDGGILFSGKPGSAVDNAVEDVIDDHGAETVVDPEGDVEGLVPPIDGNQEILGFLDKAKILKEKFGAHVIEVSNIADIIEDSDKLSKVLDFKKLKKDFEDRQKKNPEDPELGEMQQLIGDAVAHLDSIGRNNFFDTTFPTFTNAIRGATKDMGGIVKLAIAPLGGDDKGEDDKEDKVETEIKSDIKVEEDNGVDISGDIEKEVKVDDEPVKKKETTFHKKGEDEGSPFKLKF